MGWMRMDALMPLAIAMNKTFDFSDPQVKHSSNADGQWPPIRWSEPWTGKTLPKKSPYFQRYRINAINAN
jgi:hypothetical protein